MHALLVQVSGPLRPILPKLCLDLRQMVLALHAVARAKPLRRRACSLLFEIHVLLAEYNVLLLCTMNKLCLDPRQTFLAVMIAVMIARRAVARSKPLIRLVLFHLLFHLLFEFLVLVPQFFVFFSEPIGLLLLEPLVLVCELFGVHGQLPRFNTSHGRLPLGNARSGYRYTSVFELVSWSVSRQKIPLY